jgi:hypothetical protein
MKLESFEVKVPLPAVGSPVSVDAPRDTDAHKPPVVLAGGAGKVPVGNAAPFAQYQKVSLVTPGFDVYVNVPFEASVTVPFVGATAKATPYTFTSLPITPFETSETTIDGQDAAVDGQASEL